MLVREKPLKVLLIGSMTILNIIILDGVSIDGTLDIIKKYDNCIDY